MCGRYTLAAPSEELIEAFDVPWPSFELVPRYNVVPGQPAAVVGEDREGRRLGLMTWGLAPAWMDEPGGGFINARAETVASKRSFREAFERRRCLVPADGFYEWRRAGSERGSTGSDEDGATTASGAKIPFWFHPPDGGVIAFAGIWETWRRLGREARHGFAIVTTNANDDVRSVHDRMPVVIAAADRSTWLDRATSAAQLRDLLGPAPAGTFECRRVSTRVNRSSAEGPELIEPVG